MKRALTLVVTAWLLSLFANAQNVLTGKEIYRINCKAVVQIKTNEGFGVGFIVSSDGTIMTANHVVTTRESLFNKYASRIEVAIAGQSQPYQARPVTDNPSAEAVNSDSAVIKITASNPLPHLTLGSWDEVGVGDSLTILPSFPGLGCLLLQGIVSAKAVTQTGLGPNPVNVILFQVPIRNGFSGSPIFSAKGRVIGIQDTKVFGISPALDQQRKKWEANVSPTAPVTTTVHFGGADLGASMLEMINNLDQNLISGLGSGVDIAYAKEQQKAIPTKP